MFRACKEIAYKIRTASCDKMACFNEFGENNWSIDYIVVMMMMMLLVMMITLITMILLIQLLFDYIGDEQLAIDILANNVIFQNLKVGGIS